MAVQTGLRISDIVDLDRDSVMLGRGAYVLCIGKSRKERRKPLTKGCTASPSVWLKGPRKRGATALFPNIHDGRLSAGSVQALLNKYVAKVREHCITPRPKRVSPHVLRHSAAMELLQARVDSSFIALWLGHETMETTLTYLHAHLELKESALAKLEPYERRKAERFRPNDRLLEFLNGL